MTTRGGPAPLPAAARLGGGRGVRWTNPSPIAQDRTGHSELLARFRRVAQYLTALELDHPIDAWLRPEAQDFLTMLQAGHPAPEGEHDG